MARIALMAVAVTLVASPAIAADRDRTDMPPGISCEQVRAAVAEYGRIKALALALEHGATWTQIKAARRCLK